MEGPKSLRIILGSTDVSMTIDFEPGKDKPQGDKDEKILKILELFSHLTPAKQKEVLQYIEYLERRAKEEAGQDLNT